MQVFEARHWWRTYAIAMDEVARTVEIRYPEKTIKWDLDQIDTVGIQSETIGTSKKSDTEHMAQGYMLGGTAGAFLAPTQTDREPIVIKLAFNVWKTFENQTYFGAPYGGAYDVLKTSYAFPGTNKMYHAVVWPAVCAINDELQKKNKGDFCSKTPSWDALRKTVDTDEECIERFNEMFKEYEKSLTKER